MADPKENRFPEPPSDEELQARLRKLLGEDGRELENLEEQIPEEELDELDLKLREMDDKITEARAKATLPDVPDWNYKRPQEKAPEKTEYGGLGVGLSIAYTIIGFPLLGYGIGYLLQRLTGSAFWPSTLAMSGMVLGVAVAVFMLSRTQNKL
jgi:F0F1-type ATP synthase assembly protein I